MTISTGLYFMIKALTMADSKMPVPVDDSRFRVKTAVSLCGTGTTGGIFSIRLCRPVIGKEGAKKLLSQALTGGRPQTNTNTDKITHGVQARISAARSCVTSGAGGLAS